MSVNYGSKRVVTGAHYGLRDWLAQRITAGLMALFTLIVLLQVVFTSGSPGLFFSITGIASSTIFCSESALTRFSPLR